MQATGKYDITLLSMCWGYEEPYLDLNQYGIKNNIYVLDKNKRHRMLRKFISGFSYINPFDKYTNLLLDYERFHFKKLIKEYAREVQKKGEQYPEIIILQWTQIIFLIKYIKKFFSNSKIISIEEDVSFLNFERRIKDDENFIKKKLSVFRFNKLKRLELSVLNLSDLVVLNNHKDLLLLYDNNIPLKKLYELPIFFKSYQNIQRSNITNDILYYGDMARPENYNSALWFIDSVMPLLTDIDYRFIIVGAKPDKKLLRRQSDKVVITGFVKSIEPYFEKCRCMVAPLVLGAGVKVKILEAMSAGVPVLTNKIGIEGIYATDKKEYIHCETAKEYALSIKRLFKSTSIITNHYAKQFVKENYELDKAFGKFMKEELG